MTLSWSSRYGVEDDLLPLVSWRFLLVILQDSSSRSSFLERWGAPALPMSGNVDEQSIPPPLSIFLEGMISLRSLRRPSPEHPLLHFPCSLPVVIQQLRVSTGRSVSGLLFSPFARVEWFCTSAFYSTRGHCAASRKSANDNRCSLSDFSCFPTSLDFDLSVRIFWRQVR
jgi:hypothetical protein